VPRKGLVSERVGDLAPGGNRCPGGGPPGSPVESTVRQLDATLLLHTHNRRFHAHTSSSVPVSCLGTLNLVVVATCVVSLNITMTGSRSSRKEPGIESRPPYAGNRLRSIRITPADYLGDETRLRLQCRFWFSTRHHGFGHPRLSIPYLTAPCTAFSPNAHHRHI
jgi:hypothetical protein